MFSTVVETLSEALDGLAALDLDALDDTTLHQLVVATQRLRDRFDVAAGRPLARWDHRQVWRNDQSLGARQRLSNDTGCSVATAGRRLRRARSLARVPGAAAAVADGRVSVDHLDLLARAETHNPGDYTAAEAMLIDQCATLRFEQAQRVVEYWVNHADPDGREPDDDADGSSAHASETSAGTVHVTARLCGVGAHHFHTELDRLANEIRLADQRTGVTRTPAQRRGAALTEMAKRSASTPEGAQPPKPLFTVLLGDHTFSDLCETSTGRVVTPGSLTPYIDDAVLEIVYFATPTTVIAKSHRRSFTGALRRAIEVRDRYCQHPCGCDIPADRCDVDHVVPWNLGGETSQFNGRLQCHGHNRHQHLHDTGTPHPEQPAGDLDDTRQRWRHSRRQPDQPDDPDPPDQLAG